MKIQKYLLISCFAFLVLTGCYGSIAQSRAEAEQNKINMMQIEIGMSEDDVLDVLGNPIKVKAVKVDEDSYFIWFYMTKGKRLGQDKLISENFTPFIFQNKRLIGWGKNYYDLFLDIDNAKAKQEYSKSQKYTDDADEWPSNEHKIITPSKEKKEQNNSSKDKKNQSIDEQQRKSKPQKEDYIWWD